MNIDYEGGSDFNVKKMNVSNTDRFGVRRKIQLIAKSDATLDVKAWKGYKNIGIYTIG